jgi:hypothetical protein
MAGMETRTASRLTRRTVRGRLVDFADPALWAWAVVVVMLAVPAAATLA